MAHLSYASPDRKWALVLEMNPVWQPCRLIPLDGSSAADWWARRANAHRRHGHRMGSGCISELTSMATICGASAFRMESRIRSHSEPSEEEGIAMTPDGSSLITSIGTHESAVWIHDSRGDRPLSSEGHVAPMPVPPFSSIRFSSDSKELFYLIRPDSPASPSELWRADLEYRTQRTRTARTFNRRI